MHEEALGQEEENDRQNQGHKRARLNELGLLTVDAVEVSQRNGDRPELAALGQVNQGPEVIVPGKDDVEDDNGDNDWQGLWDDDGPQDAEWPRAVHHRRLIQLARQGHEVLPEQEDVVGVGEEVRHN